MYSKLAFLLALLFSGGQLHGQLVLLESGIQYLINFDENLNGVNNGSFLGNGLESDPLAGELDSDAWSIEGCSDGDSQFSGTYLNGDFARGFSQGGESIGGIYAFEVEDNNHALGMQATSSDLSPGGLILKIRNQSGFSIERMEISYRIWIFNDQNRSQKISANYSIDNIVYFSLPLSDYVSSELADPISLWTDSLFIFNLNIPALENNEYLYLKWTLEDEAGSGSRDEWAIDDIAIKITNNSCLFEDFAFSESGSSIESNEGFNLIGIDSFYDSPSNYGAHSPSARMDDDMDQLISPIVANAFALKFWIKAQGNASASSLLIEGFDGIQWQEISTISPLPGSATNISIQNISSYSQFSFTYFKQNGNLAIDDIQISCGDCLLANVPQNLSGEVQFSSIFCNQSEVSWQNNSAEYYLVIATEKASMNFLPNDHFSYGASSKFGLGEEVEDSVFVVYSGAENNFTLTQLESGKDYLIKVFSYNGLSCEENYSNLALSAVLQLPDCGQCPYLTGALINACNGGCASYEGSNEFLMLNSGEYALTADTSEFKIYYENHSISLLNEEMISNSSSIDQLNALSNCSTLFIDVSSIASIPAQSTILLCNNAICLDSIDPSLFCQESVLYVLFCQSTQWNPLGEFVNSGYFPQTFILDFSGIAASCILNYSYIPNDILQEDGAYISFSNEGAFTDQSIIDNCSGNLGVLPLIWGDFKASIIHNEVTLFWESLAEYNNSGFRIQRSRDDLNYEDIGWLNSLGNSILGFHYEYIDPLPLHGRQYYRLRQEDMDANYSYSKSILVKNASDINVYYNQGYLIMDGLGSGDYQLMIYSADGRLIFEQALPAVDEKVELLTTFLSPGVYIVDLIGKEISLAKKVFIK